MRLTNAPCVIKAAELQLYIETRISISSWLASSARSPSQTTHDDDFPRACTASHASTRCRPCVSNKCFYYYYYYYYVFHIQCVTIRHSRQAGLQTHTKHTTAHTVTGLRCHTAYSLVPYTPCLVINVNIRPIQSYNYTPSLSNVNNGRQPI